MSMIKAVNRCNEYEREMKNYLKFHFVRDRALDLKNVSVSLSKPSRLRIKSQRHTLSSLDFSKIRLNLDMRDIGAMGYIEDTEDIGEE